ncbi:MAG TPA: hypothetical protein VF691_15890 [Cytophagaceae bacterium]|jgi:hypothetical protein
MRALTYVLFYFIFTYHSFSQINAPKYSNEFLSIGIGARGLGLGGSQSALTSDVTSGYWNPAGLSRLSTKYEGALMHAEYFAGIAKYDYAGFATKLDSNSALALSFIRFGVDDIPNTLDFYDTDGNGNKFFNYDKIKFFSIADYAFLISYARKSSKIKGLSLGTSFKVIHRTVDIFANSWGFGMDAGVQYETSSGWMFGLMARDVTTTFNAWSFKSSTFDTTFVATGNTVPVSTLEITLPKFIFGVAKCFRINEKFGITTTFDLDLSTDGKRNVLLKTGVISGDPHAGIELDFKRIIYLRAGGGNIQQIKNFEGGTYTSFQPNFGIGVKVYKLTIDYALTNIGSVSESLYSNVFSIKASLK